MSYQALYRVWRPQTFDELVGQPVITETLKNAISNQQISHAYLFTGPRGTGKTSAAKIFAKAINCPHQTDGNPCNECEHCRLITQGQLSDVIEIDAASNNGVEEIRNLRENVRYAATSVKYKVYIIDEVHMLTTGAFNALLKTLEEPPENVIFILATTEPHKIPATIISRTQRFDFQRITSSQLIERMMEILDHDGIQYETTALEVIARAANGGMRDSLSLLDQALSYDSKNVSLTSALEISGSLNQLAFVEIIDAIYHQKAELALEILQKQLQKGKQASRFVEELIIFSRDLLLTIATQKNHTLLDDEEIKDVIHIESSFFYRMIDSLNEVQNKMRFSTQTDLYIEVTMVQLAQENMKMEKNHGQRTNIESIEIQQLKEELLTLQKELMDLKQRFNQDNNIQTMIQASETEIKDVPKTPRQRPEKFVNKYQLEIHKVHHILNEATRRDIGELKGQWTQLLDELSPQERAKFVGVEVIAAGPLWGLLSFTNQSFAGLVQEDMELHRHLSQITQKLLGKSMYFYLVLEQDWSGIRQQYAVLRKGNQGHPLEISDTVLNDMQSFIQKLNTDPAPSENENEILTSSCTETNTFTVNEDEDQLDPRENEELVVIQQEEIPEIVSKAIDLFGEENINIYYDR